MSRESLTREKNILLKNVTKLRENARLIETKKEHCKTGKGIQGWKDKRKLSRDVIMFEAKCLIAEKKFEILEKSSNTS